MNDDLETAVQLVREAGLSTGHADNCVELVREVVEQCEALRRKQELERERRRKLYRERDWADMRGAGRDEYLRAMEETIDDLRARLDHLRSTRIPGWCEVSSNPPKPDSVVVARWPGVYQRTVTVWRDAGGNLHFGTPDEPDGKGSQPATHYRAPSDEELREYDRLRDDIQVCGEVSVPRGWHLFTDALPDPGDVVDVMMKGDGVQQFTWVERAFETITFMGEPVAWAPADDPGGWPARYEDKVLPDDDCAETGPVHGGRYADLGPTAEHDATETATPSPSLPASVSWWPGSIVTAYDDAAGRALDRCCTWLDRLRARLDHLTRRRCCVEEPPGLVLSDEGDPPASDTGLLRSPEGRMYLAVRWGDGEWTNDQTYEADIIEGVGPGWTWTPPHCADVYS